MRMSPIVKGFAHHDVSHGHSGRRPKASNEGTGATISSPIRFAAIRAFAQQHTEKVSFGFFSLRHGRQQEFEDSPPGWPQKPTYG
jgi:hypothetical protein